MNKQIYMAPVSQKIVISTATILAGSVTGVGDDGTTGDTSNPGGSTDQGSAHAPRVFDFWDDVE